MARSLFSASASAAGWMAAGCSGYRTPMDGRWDHINYGCGFGGMFMWIIFGIIAAVIAYFFVQTLRTKTTGLTPDETPVDILKKRYAKGEITKEDYDKMKRDIEA